MSGKSGRCATRRTRSCSTTSACSSRSTSRATSAAVPAAKPAIAQRPRVRSGNVGVSECRRRRLNLRLVVVSRIAQRALRATDYIALRRVALRTVSCPRSLFAVMAVPRKFTDQLQAFCELADHLATCTMPMRCCF